MDNNTSNIEVKLSQNTVAVLPAELGSVVFIGNYSLESLQISICSKRTKSAASGSFCKAIIYYH